MKAIEVTGKIDDEGNLILDKPIKGATYPHQVRVIILVLESTDEVEELSSLSKAGINFNLLKLKLS
ncbi:hypothetical protein WA1_31620 [Scytonema hofmannii PCC 7110]|uniref:Uncharacterized protein n=1 Tax=Scytonema hofmannii PCC 7110 TaxID=128403 RepID=A0A139X3K4_9CYAN|nr:hypothetical protein [Scytonema hofmannii]KYC39289.1 hypothetical protein WA1_31620 [Scytonema hofmannii PCC 7110]